MKKIDRKKICDYINSLLTDRCYVGLHSIVDVPTTSNEYDNLSKEERAISILENGLLNGRGGTLNHTVKFFGNLAIADSEIKDSMSNYYQGINRSGENYVAVVAIPYFFKGQQGKLMFGGYKSYDSESQFRESPECISEMLLSKKVPPEMILGYYTYDDNEQIVSFTENPRYYSKLSSEEKLKFVTNHFGKYVDLFDINDPKAVESMSEFVKKMGKVNNYFNNTISQYLSLKESTLDFKQYIPKKINQEEFTVSSVSYRYIQLEYPDATIHNVECYRLAKAQLSNTRYVYFIEYYDNVVGSDERIDSYAILENINGIFCKSDLKIDYNTLNSNVIRDLDLSSLSSTITMKGSKKTQELMTYINNQSNLNLRNENLHSNGSSYLNTKEKEVKDSEEIVYVVLPTIDGKEKEIDFETITHNLKRMVGFVVKPELKQTSVEPGYNYTIDCKVLSPRYIDKITAENTVDYLKNLSNNQSLNVEQLQDVVVGNCRYQFIPSNKSQYNTTLFNDIELICLPIKRHKANISNKDMFQRFMSGTSLGYFKIKGTYYRCDFQLSEKDKANLFLLMYENSTLNHILGRTDNNDILFPVDSYDLDDVIDRLQMKNQELKKFLSMTPEKIQSYENNKDLQKFVKFFLHLV